MFLFRNLEFVDSTGSPTNSIPLGGDIFVKYIVPSDISSDERDVYEQMVSGNEPLENGVYTLALTNLAFTLGTGNSNCNTSDGFDDFTLLSDANEMKPFDQYSLNAFGVTATDTFLVENPAAYQIPYMFTLLSPFTESGSQGAYVDENFYSGRSFPLNQSDISSLERAADGTLESMLITIKGSYLSGVFTSEGVSFDSSAIKTLNEFISYEAHTGGVETDGVLAMTGGSGYGNSPYPAFENGTAFVPYLDINKITIGFQLLPVLQTGNQTQQTGVGSLVGGLFDTSVVEETFSLALTPLVSLNVDHLTSPDFSFSGAMSMESYVCEPLQSVSGEITFSTNDFQGNVIFLFLDNDFIQTIESEGNTSLEELANGGFISEDWNQVDDAANYGTLTVVGEVAVTGQTVWPIVLDNVVSVQNVVPGEVVKFNFTYTSSSELTGPNDDFTVFASFHQVESSPPNWQQHLENTGPYLYRIDLPQPIVTVFSSEELPEIGFDEYIPSGDRRLIENPSDIMFHLIEQEFSYNRDVNADKIDDARQNQKDFKLGFSLDTPIGGKRLLQEISLSSKCVPTFGGGKLSFAHIKDTYRGGKEYYEDAYGEDVYTINSQDVLSYTVSRSDINKVYTRVELHYNYDYGSNLYKNVKAVSVNNSPAKTSISDESVIILSTYGITGDLKSIRDESLSFSNTTNYYGFDFDKELNILKHNDTTLRIENKYIREEGTAKLLADHLLSWRCNQHNEISLRLPLKYYNLEVGDVCDFNEMILGKTIYGEKYVLDDFENIPVRCGQYILPLFIVTDITKSIDSVSVKLTQLHHMSQDNLNWKNNVAQSVYSEINYFANIIGTGDVNYDGFVDVLDIVQVVQYILGFAQVDELAADINQDGSVDVLDIVLMVSSILGD